MVTKQLILVYGRYMKTDVTEHRDLVTMYDDDFTIAQEVIEDGTTSIRRIVAPVVIRENGRYWLHIPISEAGYRMIVSYFTGRGIPTSAKRANDETIDGKPITVTIDQTASLTELQEEAFDYLQSHSTPLQVLNMNTGKGKSFISISYIARIAKVRTLAVFHRASHRDNFVSELLKFTNIDQDEILVLRTADIQKRKFKIPANVKVIAMLHSSLMSDFRQSSVEEDFGSQYGPLPVINGQLLISKLIKKANIGLTLVDETHLSLASLNLLLSTNNSRNFLTMTATLGRSSKEEKRVFKKFLFAPSSHLSSFIHKETYDLEVKMVKLHLFHDVAFFHKYSRFIQKKYFMPCNYFKVLTQSFDTLTKAQKKEPGRIAVVQHFKYVINLLIAEGLSIRENKASNIALVTSGSLETIDFIVKHVQSEYPKLKVSEYSSRVKKNASDILHDADIIITTEKSFDASINPLRLEVLILLAPNMKSPIQVEQMIGRLRGKKRKRKVIDVFDTTSHTTSNSADARYTLYQKLAVDKANVVLEEWDSSDFE